MWGRRVAAGSRAVVEGIRKGSAMRCILGARARSTALLVVVVGAAMWATGVPAGASTSGVVWATAGSSHSGSGRGGGGARYGRAAPQPSKLGRADGPGTGGGRA